MRFILRTIVIILYLAQNARAFCPPVRYYTPEELSVFEHVPLWDPPITWKDHARRFFEYHLDPDRFIFLLFSEEANRSTSAIIDGSYVP